MSDEYRKILNHPEVRYRYWHIHKDDRDFFPPAHQTFKLKFYSKTYELKVNHKDDIMTGMLFQDYKFFEGNEIVIKKIKGNYVLTADDAKSW